MGDAMKQVEEIQIELERVLEDMNEVLKTLEQAEREKTATDDEIEDLRESLRNIHRLGGSPRPSRAASSRSPAPSARAPREPVSREPAAREEDDDSSDRGKELD